MIARVIILKNHFDILGMLPRTLPIFEINHFYRVFESGLADFTSQKKIYGMDINYPFKSKIFRLIDCVLKAF